MTIKSINNSKVNQMTKDKDKDNLSLRIDLTDISDRMKEEYLDKHEGVTSEILNTTRFDENIDLSTTYLGKSSMT